MLTLSSSALSVGATVATIHVFVRPPSESCSSRVSLLSLHRNHRLSPRASTATCGAPPHRLSSRIIVSPWEQCGVQPRVSGCKRLSLSLIPPHHFTCMSLLRCLSATVVQTP